MENGNALLRLSPDIAGILGKLAKIKHFSEAMVLEMLILKEASRMGVIGSEHPETAYFDLINLINDWALEPHEDYTLHVFERIAATPEALTLWEKAVTPTTPEQRADKRKQFVNQRLGRFCKRYIGWESADEVQLGKDRINLIQSYTRLRQTSTAT